LSSIEKFKGKRENFIFNTFIYFEPVKRFKNSSGMTKFRSSDDSTSKEVLDVFGDMFNVIFLLCIVDYVQKLLSYQSQLRIF